MIEAKETEGVLLLGVKYERDQRGRKERRRRKGHRQWRVRKREERGGRKGGEFVKRRSTASLSIGSRARRNEGSPRWPPGSGAPVSPASATQHKSLPLRSVSLCSLSRLCARAYSLANSLQKCDRTANTGFVFAFTCLIPRLRSHFAARCGHDGSQSCVSNYGPATSYSTTNFGNIKLSLSHYFCKMDYFSVEQHTQLIIIIIIILTVHKLQRHSHFLFLIKS